MKEKYLEKLEYVEIKVDIYQNPVAFSNDVEFVIINQN